MSIELLQPEAGDDRQPSVEIQKLQERWAVSTEHEANTERADFEAVSGLLGRSILRPFVVDLPARHYLN